jgi:hypothetical protein
VTTKKKNHTTKAANKDAVRRNLELAQKLAAMGRPLSIAQIQSEIGRHKTGGENFLQACAHVPWIEIRQTTEGRQFFIDEVLKTICELHAKQKRLQGKSVTQFFMDFQKELQRRRKEHNDRKEKRPWNPEQVIKLELIQIQDWVEKELNTFNHG